MNFFLLFIYILILIKHDMYSERDDMNYRQIWFGRTLKLRSKLRNSTTGYLLIYIGEEVVQRANIQHVYLTLVSENKHETLVTTG